MPIASHGRVEYNTEIMPISGYARSLAPAGAFYFLAGYTWHPINQNKR